MSWLILTMALALGLGLAFSGPKRVNRFRPLGRRKRFKPTAKKTQRGGRLQLDLASPFGSGEVEGIVPEKSPGILSFNLGVVPTGDLVYVAAVEFEGGGYQGSGFYRLIVQGQPGGMSEIRVGPVMPSSKGEHWLPAALQLSAYLVDPELGAVGFAGFSFSDGRMLFSVALLTVVPPEGLRVRVKWSAFET